MEQYINVGSPKTPVIKFDLINGFLEIKGRSIPENSIEFYRPLLVAVDNYLRVVKPITIVTMHLEYSNTNSSKCILDVFKKLANVHRVTSFVSVNWYYEDDDMLEAGEDYRALINIPFKMIQVA
ncbi:MAG: DUF1987 domain-containing protein [Bacteroidetes bacterium]|nr:DUF1987 domain-containing protein [Bacteroidota bacterium]